MIKCTCSHEEEVVSAGYKDCTPAVVRVEELEFFYAGRSYCKLLDMSFMVRIFHFWKGGDNVRELHKCFQHKYCGA